MWLQVYLGNVIPSNITGNISNNKNIIYLHIQKVTFEDLLNGNLVSLNLKNISSLEGSVTGFSNELNLIELNLGSKLPNANITGDLSTFSNLTNMTNLALDNAAITGNLSDVVLLTNLRVVLNRYRIFLI